MHNPPPAPHVESSKTTAPAAVRPLSEQRQMVEIEAAMTARRQADVYHMIGARYEADEAGQQKHGALGSALRLGNRIYAHAHQAGAND